MNGSPIRDHPNFTFSPQSLSLLSVYIITPFQALPLPHDYEVPHEKAPIRGALLSSSIFDDGHYVQWCRGERRWVLGAKTEVKLLYSKLGLDGSAQQLFETGIALVPKSLCSTIKYLSGTGEGDYPEVMTMCPE
jgi:hypothetical protein